MIRVTKAQHTVYTSHRNALNISAWLELPSQCRSWYTLNFRALKEVLRKGSSQHYTLDWVYWAWFFETTSVIAQDILNLTTESRLILNSRSSLPIPPECWDYRTVPSCPATSFTVHLLLAMPQGAEKEDPHRYGLVFIHARLERLMVFLKDSDY